MSGMNCYFCQEDIPEEHQSWILKQDPSGMGGDEEPEKRMCYSCRYKLRKKSFVNFWNQG